MENDTVEKTLKNSYDFAKNKTETKTCYQTNKEKNTKKFARVLQKSLRRKKIKKKGIMITIEIKHMSYVDTEKRKQYIKKYYNKRRKLLNYLAICFKEIENVCINRENWKVSTKF